MMVTVIIRLMLAENTIALTEPSCASGMKSGSSTGNIKKELITATTTATLP